MKLHKKPPHHQKNGLCFYQWISGRFFLTTFLLPSLLTSLLVSGCVSIPSPSQRQLTAEKIISQQGWQPILIQGHNFDLKAYTPAPKNTDVLTIYIEGDGFAWRTQSEPSTDPTPINPLGLKLALAHPGGNAAYLARPYQYVGGLNGKGCNKTYWTQKRFAVEVIEASDQALTVLKLRFGAHHLQLVGYSGGGAVATLLAAQRDDVVRLVTVAGNLDHRAWTDAHHIQPLDGSLNPIDYWPALTKIPQVHFVGEKDLIINKAIAVSYRKRFTAPQNINIVSLSDFNHHCCWVESWPALWKQYVQP
jgi:dienelactone hydrolase